MNNILVILMFSGVRCSLADVCKYGWASYDSKRCYYVTNVKEEGNKAAEHCRELGGDLAVISTLAEKEFVKRYIESENRYRSLKINKIHDKVWIYSISTTYQYPDGSCFGQFISWYSFSCRKNKYYSLCEKRAEIELEEKGNNSSEVSNTSEKLEGCEQHVQSNE